MKRKFSFDTHKERAFDENHLLEYYHVRENMFPFINCTSTQRQGMASTQFQNKVSTIFSEEPYIDTNLSSDILSHSSCIEKYKGSKITIKKKFTYQNTTYIFYTDDKDILQLKIFEKYLYNAGFANKIKSDLLTLEENVTYEITNNDDFYLEYIDLFNPVTGVVSYGINARTTFNSDISSSNDSCAISRSFANKLSTLKYDEIKIELPKNKKILSKYEDIFPPLNTLLTDNVLFRIVNEDNLLSSILLDANTPPSGFEETVKFIRDNSFIHGIEVYSNNEIANPILNNYRIELNQFKDQIFNYIRNNYKATQISPDVARIFDNFSYSKRRIEDRPIDNVFMIIKVVSVNHCQVGSKLSNRHGGKVTIQEIKEDDQMIDEFGNTVEILGPPHSIIGRTNFGMLYEHYCGTIIYFFELIVKSNKYTNKELYKVLKNMYYLLNLEKEFNSLKLTDEELIDFIKRKKLRFILKPFSHELDIARCAVLTKYLEEVLHFTPLQIYIKSRPLNNDVSILDTKFNKLKHLFEQYIKKMSNKNMFTNITEDERLEIFNVNYEKIFKHKYIPQTSPTHIGYIYWFNLIHDPNYGTSAIGNMNLDNRNYPADKSNSKKVMESLFSEASSKLCVQTLGITSSMVHEEAYSKLIFIFCLKF